MKHVRWEQIWWDQGAKNTIKFMVQPGRNQEIRKDPPGFGFSIIVGSFLSSHRNGCIFLEWIMNSTCFGAASPMPGQDQVPEVWDTHPIFAIGVSPRSHPTTSHAHTHTGGSGDRVVFASLIVFLHFYASIIRNYWWKMLETIYE